MLAGAVFVGGPAWAQPTGNTPAMDASQNGGTVLRLRVGPAYLNANLGQQDVPAQHYSGAGFAFDAEIGRSLTSTVTVCGELSGMLALDAKADDSGTLLTGAPTAFLRRAGDERALGAGAMDCVMNAMAASHAKRSLPAVAWNHPRPTR